MPFDGPVIRFGVLVEYHPISAIDLSRLHQFGPKVLPGIFFGYALHTVRIWKGDILGLRHGSIWTNIDVSEIHSRKTQCKASVKPMRGDNFIFPVADATVKISGGDQRLRTSTLIRDSPDRGEEQEVLRGESDGSSPTPRQDSSWCDGEANNDV